MLGIPTTVRTPEMVDSANVLILADRRVTTEETFEQLEISEDTALKTMGDDLVFSKARYSRVFLEQCKASY